MQHDQKMIMHDGMQVPIPTLNIDLHVPPNFTGRVVVHIKDGRAIADYRLNQADHITTLSGFIELARAAGWEVNPPVGDRL